jgi:hypothetical protein
VLLSIAPNARADFVVAYEGTEHYPAQIKEVCRDRATRTAQNAIVYLAQKRSPNLNRPKRDRIVDIG